MITVMHLKDEKLGGQREDWEEGEYFRQRDLLSSGSN